MMKKTALLLTLCAVALCVGGENKPYITRIYDFQPAPGQFCNVLPQYSTGDSKDDILENILMDIGGFEKNGKTVVADYLISLGAFGGYVVFGFDHPIVNVKGQYDFQIFGNAFKSDSLDTSGGSSEPGIVMVSKDVNGNGVPDDAWYELAGSEYHNPKTNHNYQITYYRPNIATNWRLDTCSVRWTSNDTDSVPSGRILKNEYHLQSYWPMWVSDNTINFTAEKLPCNAANEGTEQKPYWVQHFYDWGYVDNRPDYKYDGSTPQPGMNFGFKIDWAVDESGNSVELDQIDFIKVYTAINHQAPQTGETSTEVAGAIDLHHPFAKWPKGDLNHDLKVDVSDVTSIINVILGNLSIEDDSADLNGDQEVNVSDVTGIINMILAQ